MTQIEEIQKQIQAGTLRLDLDQVHVRPDTGGEWLAIEYPCWMTCADGDLHFHFRPGLREALTDSVKELFNLERGDKEMVMISVGDCYEVSARTATGVHVLLRYVSPVPDSQWSTNFVISISTGFQRLDFPTTGMEQLTLPEVEAYLREKQRQHDAILGVEREDEVQVSAKPVRDWFKAIIPGVKLLIERETTKAVEQHPFYGELRSARRSCFIEKVLGGEFCLENKDGDIQVIYRREVGGASEAEVRQVFDGVLTAVGFMHGCHPWVGAYEHTRHGKVLERWVKPQQNLQKDPLLPMAKGRMYHAKDGSDLFIKAAEFFAGDGAEVEYFRRSLWLMRSACVKGMAFPVRLLTLCSILEGLVKPYRGPKPQGRRMTAEDQLRVRWQEPIRAMGLSWDWFEPVVESYNNFRGHLAHGFEPDRQSREFGEELNAYSRISAAIYILMAKRMEFSGELEQSQLEGKALVDLGAEFPSSD